MPDDVGLQRQVRATVAATAAYVKCVVLVQKRRLRSTETHGAVDRSAQSKDGGRTNEIKKSSANRGVR